MERCLTVKDLMNVLGCDRSKAYALVKMPGFPSARLGKKIIIPAEALKEWLANGGTAQKGA